jgi:hypothetical protein
MLGLREEATLSAKVVAHGVEAVGERGKMRSNAREVVNDRDIAAILEKANKLPNAAEIGRPPECARAVPRTATPMPCETADNRLIHTDERNATSLQPKQEMPRCAAVVP